MLSSGHRPPPEQIEDLSNTACCPERLTLQYSQLVMPHRGMSGLVRKLYDDSSDRAFPN